MRRAARDPVLGGDPVTHQIAHREQRLQSAARVGEDGHVVFYGMAGGDPPLVDPRMLMDTSKTLTGGDLWNVLRTAEDRRARAAELFAWVREGAFHLHIAARFPLAEGAAAHAFLESRKSSGKCC